MAITPAHDVVSTSPTNTFATLNALVSFSSSHDELTISNGNLKGDVSTAASKYGLGFSTVQLPKSGKFYVEVLVTLDGSGNSLSFGCVSPTSYVPTSNSFAIYANSTFSGILLHQYNETVRSVVNGSLGTTVSFSRTNTILGILFDIDNSSMTGWYNDNQLTIASSGINYDDFIIAIESPTHSTNRSDFICNFGQDHTFGGATLPSGAGSNTPSNGIGTFAFSVPSGAKALCTANLPDPVIDPNVDDLPEDYFKCVGYDGDESGFTENIGFQPDFLWAKGRTIANSGIIIDSLRPHTDTNSFYRLHPDYADAQADYNDNIYITSNGFGCGSQESGVNDDGYKFVAWCWKAGGSPDLTSNPTKPFAKDNVQYTDTTANKVTVFGNASNYNITPTSASIGTKQGCGIYLFTASSNNKKLPHGLGKAPELVILKSTNYNGTNWVVTFCTLGHDFNLNNTASRLNGSSSGAYFQTTADADVITFGLDSFNDSNKAGNTYVVYAFTSVPGFSAFGSVANLNNNEFVYLGFKPAWVMFKRTTSTSNWTIYDNARNPHNVCDKLLNSDTANVESTYASLDLLSNGFKARSFSGVSGEWLYMAFAEMPQKFAVAR